MTQFCFLCKYIQTPTKYKSSKYQTQFHALLDYTHFAYCRNVDTHWKVIQKRIVVKTDSIFK